MKVLFIFNFAKSLLPFLLFLAFSGCGKKGVEANAGNPQNNVGSGIVTGEILTFFGTQVAAGATVIFVSVGYNPTDSGQDSSFIADSVVTDSEGKYSYQVVTSGLFNIFAEKDGMKARLDSLALTTQKDTIFSPFGLGLPGHLWAHVVLDSGDAPEKVAIFMHGSTILTYPDSTGFFHLLLAYGWYHATFLPNQPGYEALNIRLTPSPNDIIMLGTEFKLEKSP